MAIAVTVPTAAVAFTTNVTSYALGAFTPTGNAILVFIVTATGTVDPGTVTDTLGLKWIKIASQLYDAVDTIYAFYAITPAAPGSDTITFNCAGDAATGCVLQIFQFTGADLITPIVQSAKNAVTGANPVATFKQAMQTLNGYCAVFGNQTNPPGATIPTSWTQNASTGYITPTAGAQGAYRAGGETITTVTFTLASQAYGMIAVEVAVDALGVASSPVPITQMGSGGFVGQILGG
jgi:hypothetical protein